MPKVLRIINRLNLGGPTYNAAYLTAFLAPEYETLLVAGLKDDTEESSEFIVRSLGIEPLYIENMEREISFSKDYDAYKQLDKIIKEFKPDIVHTHAAKAGTLGRIAAWRNKVPVIVHTFHGHVFHSYFGPAKTRVFIEIERLLGKVSTGIIAISEEQRLDLTVRYTICKENKVHVVPLGFDLNKFREKQPEKRLFFRNKYGLDEDTLAIGIIGRLVPIKNHKLFLEAWKKVVDTTQQKVHAFIIGDGESRSDIETLCNNFNLSFNTPTQNVEGANITFTSWILDIDIPLAGLDIIALTSFNEGTPVSLIEAQAAGKPIATTEVGGISNATLPNITALLSPSNDISSFTKNLLKLIENKELRAEMSAAGPEFSMSKYHYLRLVDDMKVLYNQLLNKNLKDRS
jgi:glycosyltransferase involved in cell wall biosynthesis